MADPQAQTRFALRIARTFRAPRERVFRAWTDPREIVKWWGPKDFLCTGAESDPRPGGKYRITIRGKEKGEVYTVRGEYRVVEPPERLVYTWRWDQWDPAMWETLVTVEFRDLGGTTELVLTHELFRDQGMRDEHEGGYGGCLDSLAEFLG